MIDRLCDRSTDQYQHSAGLRAHAHRLRAHDDGLDRTATSLITFGFSVYKFFEIEMQNAPPIAMLLGPRGFGLALIGIGLLSLVLGTVEHARDLRALRRLYSDMPRSMSKFVSIVVGALGLFALIAVLMNA